MEEQPKRANPICIVLDTNIWKREPLLRTDDGYLLLKTVKYRKGVIGLPEVIEREVIKHAGQEAHRHATSARKLKNFIGQDILLPEGRGAEPYEVLARGRLGELRPQLSRWRTTAGQLRRAYERVMDCRPPNADKNQQFKDSVLWEALLEHSTIYTVHFITDDGAFFGEKVAILHEVLAAEIRAHRGALTVHRISLAEFLDTLAPPDLEEEAVTQAVERDVLSSFNAILMTVPSVADIWPSRGKRIGAVIDAFLTDVLGELAIEFSLTYELPPQHAGLGDKTSEEPGRTITLEIQEGCCSWDTTTGKAANGQFVQITHMTTTATGHSSLRYSPSK